MRCKEVTLLSPENVTVTLPRSDAGSVTSDLSCFTTGIPFTTAVCEVKNDVASWKNIIWQPCEMEDDTIHTKQLKEYANVAINNEVVQQIAANLSTETKDPISLSNQDILYTVVTLGKITDLVELDITVVNNVLAIVGNLMGAEVSNLGIF